MFIQWNEQYQSSQQSNEHTINIRNDIDEPYRH